MTVRTTKPLITLLTALSLNFSSAQAYDLQGLIPGGLQGVGSIPYAGVAGTITQIWQNRSKRQASAPASAPIYTAPEQSYSVPTGTAPLPAQSYSAPVPAPALQRITPALASAAPVPQPESIFNPSVSTPAYIAPASKEQTDTATEDKEFAAWLESSNSAFQKGGPIPVLPAKYKQASERLHTYWVQHPPQAPVYSLCSVGAPPGKACQPGMSSHDFFGLFQAYLPGDIQSEPDRINLLINFIRIDRNIIDSTEYFACSTKLPVMMAGCPCSLGSLASNKFVFVKRNGQFVLSSIYCDAKGGMNSTLANFLVKKYGQPQENINERNTSHIWHDGSNVIMLAVPVNTDWGKVCITTPELLKLEAAVEN